MGSHKKHLRPKESKLLRRKKLRKKQAARRLKKLKIVSEQEADNVDGNISPQRKQTNVESKMVDYSSEGSDIKPTTRNSSLKIDSILLQSSYAGKVLF